MNIFLKAETDEDLERVIRYNIGKAYQIRKELKMLEEITVKKDNLKVVTTNVQETFIDETKDIEEEIEEYLYYYSNLLEALSETTEKEEKQKVILENLPSVDNKNYVNIVNRIKLELLKEIYELENLKQTETDSEFIGEIDNEITNINELIKIIKEVQSIKITEDTNFISSINNRIIFLQTYSGSTYAENDLYSIPEEYYELFKNLILSIENGTFKNVRRFASTNNNLKGISEVKDFKTRVIFDRIDKNTYIIIDIFVKKTDNDNGYRNALNIRIDHYKKNKAVIIEQLKDETYLEKHQEIRDNLINGLTQKSIIKTMKRG